MRTYSFHDSLARHPELTGRPVSVSALRDHFAPRRRNSCESLLIKMGPFIGATDAFQCKLSFPAGILNFESSCGVCDSWGWARVGRRDCGGQAMMDACWARLVIAAL